MKKWHYYAEPARSKGNLEKQLRAVLYLNESFSDERIPYRQKTYDRTYVRRRDCQLDMKDKRDVWIWRAGIVGTGNSNYVPNLSRIENTSWTYRMGSHITKTLLLFRLQKTKFSHDFSGNVILSDSQHSLRKSYTLHKFLQRLGILQTFQLFYIIWNCYIWFLIEPS